MEKLVEDLEEMVLEMQVDMKRMEREEDLMEENRRREGKESNGKGAELGALHPCASSSEGAPPSLSS